MYSIDDMYNPVMYQDIMNPSAGYVNSMMYGGLYPATNFLGSTQMKEQPMQDAFETIDKKKSETKNNLKSAAKVLGLVILCGLIPPAVKYVKKSGGKLCGKISKMFGNLFKAKGTSKP